jgi:hypothetical protein
MAGDRECDVAAVVSAWRLGRDVAQFRFLDATEDQLDDASARQVLDDLIADGWQRPGCSDTNFWDRFHDEAFPDDPYLSGVMRAEVERMRKETDG